MASVYADRRFDELRASDWNAPLAIDLGASFYCAQAAAPLMRARGGGRIVNFSDWTARSEGSFEVFSDCVAWGMHRNRRTLATIGLPP